MILKNKNSRLFSFGCILFVAIFFCFGCNPSLTNKGIKVTEDIREKYGCLEIVTGKSTQTDDKGNQIKFTNIHFAKCKGQLNYDSIQNYPLVREQLLDKLFPELNKNEFSGCINLEFDYESDIIKGYKSYLYLLDKSTKKLVLSDSSFVNKF